MTKEDEEDSQFVLAESIILAASAGGIGPLEVDENNRADGTEANNAPILLSGCTSNLRSEDMVELHRHGIAIYYDNNPAPGPVDSKHGHLQKHLYLPWVYRAIRETC